MDENDDSFSPSIFNYTNFPSILELNENENIYEIQELKNEDKTNDTKNKASSLKIIINNPLLTHFNQDSHFVYDIDTVNVYISKVNNVNQLKLNDSEIDIIKTKIKLLQKEKECYKKNKIVYIEKGLAFDVESFMQEKIDSKDELTIFLEKTLTKNDERVNLSLRKLAKEYKDKTGLNVSKSTVHNYLRKKLGYKYLKSTVKTDEIIKNKNILISLSFIKIISRCLKFNFSIIFCDETYIQSRNNNLKIWRKSREEIVNKISKKEKVNLILSVYEEGVLYYEINKPNTKEENFLEYMKNLLNTINDKGLKNYVIILDNYSAHKTKTLFKFYVDNKMNILFNSPYMSKFNSVELAFRNIKRHLYTKCFANMSSTINELKLILDSVNFSKSIKGNYKETLEEYILYSNKEKKANLNSLAKD